MSNLNKIFDFCKNNKKNEVYWIPRIWNVLNFDKVLDHKKNEIAVNIYEYISFYIEKILNYPTSITERKEDIIYNVFVRYTTAWDYKHNSCIELGSFLKTILLLPFLKDIGVNILYTLPISEYSTMKLKGEIGSPYAVKNFYKLDEHLHDNLLDDMHEDFSIENEFCALVEACHLLDIKVVTDLIPRVCAVDNDLIKNHPDWFYWIKKEYAQDFNPPVIDELSEFVECNKSNIEQVYRSKTVKSHIEKFVFPPDVNSREWKEVQKNADKDNILNLIEKQFGITVAPAHSDWINDSQPIWSDITFMKLFLDVNPLVKKFIDNNQAPFVMFDTIKCSNFPALKPNKDLWDYLCSIPLYFINTFGVDGFRIDMGHALPMELLNELFNCVKTIKKDAIFICEELTNKKVNTDSVHYDFSLGNTWKVMTEVSKNSLKNHLIEVSRLETPIFASPEISDTPRITTRKGGIKLSRSMAVYNYLLKNAVPFIVTGYEVNEIQPLNCGLADNTNGSVVKKAFFDKTSIDWTSVNACSMVNLLKKLYKICNENSRIIANGELNIIDTVDENLLIFEYCLDNDIISCVINLGDEYLELNVNKLFPYRDYTVLIDTDDNGCLLLEKIAPLQAYVLKSTTYED